MTPIPDELLQKPLALGTTKPSELKIKEIQDELAKRHAEDQAIQRAYYKDPNPKRREEADEVMSNNTAYLLELVKEFGWIDVERFGVEASSSAFLIVQHSGHIPMMRAALPAIEEDVKAKKLGSAAPYALLYDRLALQLGGKQRYGSQTCRDAHGDQVVRPLENPGKVDDFRKELGLVPLAEYLSFWEKKFGVKVKIPTE